MRALTCAVVGPRQSTACTAARRRPQATAAPAAGSARRRPGDLAGSCCCRRRCAPCWRAPSTLCTASGSCARMRGPWLCWWASCLALLGNSSQGGGAAVPSPVPRVGSGGLTWGTLTVRCTIAGSWVRSPASTCRCRGTSRGSRPIAMSDSAREGRQPDNSCNQAVGNPK